MMATMAAADRNRGTNPTHLNIGSALTRSMSVPGLVSQKGILV